MVRSAKDGTCLASLVAMAIPSCQEAEQRWPRTGPGRRPEIPDWAMAVLIMVVVAKKKKSKSAQYRYLAQHRSWLQGWLKISRFPSRTTYFERYRRAYILLEKAIRVQGEEAIHSGVVKGQCVAVDKSLLTSRGRLWHQRDRRRGIVPPRVDVESTWSYSKHHGWVQGYSYEVLVTADKQGPVWPLLASVDPAHWREYRTFPKKISQLPESARYVLADAGYDSNAHGESVEWDESGRRTGRRFLCAMQGRQRESVSVKPWRETRTRRQHRLLRERRRNHNSTPRARKLYARRSTTVEPFNEWLKCLFDLHNTVWHYGLNNNRTQILAAIFTYQLLLRYNWRQGKHDNQVHWILDTL